MHLSDNKHLRSDNLFNKKPRKLKYIMFDLRQERFTQAVKEDDMHTMEKLLDYQNRYKNYFN